MENLTVVQQVQKQRFENVIKWIEEAKANSASSEEIEDLEKMAAILYKQIPNTETPAHKKEVIGAFLFDIYSKGCGDYLEILFDILKTDDPKESLIKIEALKNKEAGV